MSIWFKPLTPDDLSGLHGDTLAGHLEITITEIGDDYLVGTMPITSKSVQPFRTMHGGASAALAETLGSVGAQLVVDPAKYACVGLSLNVSHIRAVPEGQIVTGTARPFHLGRSTHVWDIQITDPRGKLATVARLTMSVLDRPGDAFQRKSE